MSTIGNMGGFPLDHIVKDTTGNKIHFFFDVPTNITEDDEYCFDAYLNGELVSTKNVVPRVGPEPIYSNCFEYEPEDCRDGFLINRGYHGTNGRYVAFNGTGVQCLDEPLVNAFDMFSTTLYPTLTSLDLSSLDVSQVACMSQMFRHSFLLTNVSTRGWDTSNVYTMAGMFESCNSLISIGGISDWDVSMVGSFENMFYGCESLIELDLSGWDTSNVTSFRGMFQNCSSLVSLDLSGWDMPNIISTYRMFDGCSSLETLNLSDWKVYSLFTDFPLENAKYMFQDCSSLTNLDLSGWDVTNLKDISYMFNGCSSLETLDVSGWALGDSVDTIHLFSGCTSLKTIYALGCNGNTIRVLRHHLPTCDIVTE